MTSSLETTIETEPLESFHRRALQFLTDTLAPLDRSVVTSSEDRVSLPIVGGTSMEEDERALAAARSWRRARTAAGFGWISGPTVYGGRGFDVSYERAFDQLERQFEVPDPSYLRTGMSIVGPTIQRLASEQVRDALLPGIYAGDHVVCQLFSEPNAGSDLASVQTRAVRDGDSWVVSGQKVWSSGARHATLGECLVRTSSDGPKHAGLTMLLVDMTSAGIDVRPIHQMTGGSEFYEVFLDNVTVPDWMTFGRVGEGWAATTDTLANERATIGEQILPAAWLQRRLLDAVATRGALGDPVIRQLVVDAVVRLILAGRLPKHLAITKAPPAAVALSKLAASTSVECVARAVAAAIGPALVAQSGEPDTYSWSELVLGLPGLRIGGGTDEVLKTMIAERVLGLPREPS